MTANREFTRETSRQAPCREVPRRSHLGSANQGRAYSPSSQSAMRSRHSSQKRRIACQIAARAASAPIGPPTTSGGAHGPTCARERRSTAPIGARALVYHLAMKLDGIGDFFEARRFGDHVNGAASLAPKPNLSRYRFDADEIAVSLVR